MPKFVLGERVKVDIHDALFRCRRYGTARKEWIKLTRANDPDIREGVLIGERTYSNGDIEYDYDAGTTYYMKETFKVVLVVFSLRERPVAFYPKDVKPV